MWHSGASRPRLGRLQVPSAGTSPPRLGSWRQGPATPFPGGCYVFMDPCLLTHRLTSSERKAEFADDVSSWYVFFPVEVITFVLLDYVLWSFFLPRWFWAVFPSGTAHSTGLSLFVAASRIKPICLAVMQFADQFTSGVKGNKDFEIIIAFSEQRVECSCPSVFFSRLITPAMAGTLGPCWCMIAFLTLERAGVWIRALRSDTVYVESILISIFHYLFIFTEFIIIVFVCVCVTLVNKIQ